MNISACLRKAGLTGAFAIASLVALHTGASATTIKFDDLDGSGFDGHQITTPYMGYNWSNIYALGTDLKHIGPGYTNGIVSKKNIAYNGFAHESFVTKADSKLFLFGGGFFTAAYDDPDPGDIIKVHITGLLNGNKMYDLYIKLNTLGPQFVDIAKLLDGNVAIDKLRIASVHQSQIVMDNLELTAVPIPAALPLFGTALGFGALVLRRRKPAKAA